MESEHNGLMESCTQERVSNFNPLNFSKIKFQKELYLTVSSGKFISFINADFLLGWGEGRPKALGML
jgi:hypothetical protein